MAAVLYICPTIREPVSGWVADGPDDDHRLVTLSCLACHTLHRVNPKTGKVAGAELPTAKSPWNTIVRQLRVAQGVLFKKKAAL